jgi:6-phosphogluconolactonase/glucosamine-6-phosphate isomerase/deaminase
MTDFKYEPSKYIPFRDTEAIERVRKIKRADIDKHKNPSLNIQVVPDDQVEFLWIMDMFYRIKTASDEGKRLVLILPNPAHTYMKVAMLINRFRVDCSKLFIFIMDEYADQDGNIAPESYPQGFLRATKNYFYYRIKEDLRPPQEQIVGPTNDNVSDYGKMIADMGGADACYSGPGWTGHLAFIEPDAPEFEADLEEWKKMGPRIVTLSPFTIAQNSLHGSFGYSGDMAMVPPKAFTIGPAEVIGAKYRMDMHALTTMGTKITWQRMASRLCLHGPVTPKLPTSLHQLLKSDIFISETIAQDIEPDWTFGY